MAEDNRIDLAVWRWDDSQPLPEDIVALHAGLDAGTAHPAMTRFDADAFVDALQGLFERASSGGESGEPWTYQVNDGTDGGANWVRFRVEIGLIQLFAPQLVNIAVVHQLVVSDPHNDHIIGA